jgi:GTPase SAR1 family protein
MNVSGQHDNPFVVYKIITLGDAGIGKTCLTVRYC